MKEGPMISYEKSIDWLLEPTDPGVRYLALRDLANAGTKDLKSARTKAHSEGEIAAVLAKMKPEAYWVGPGGGYLPKYTASVWSIILLAQLGARVENDERIARACRYYLDHAFNAGGQISLEGAPSSTVDCLQGNM